MSIRANISSAADDRSTRLAGILLMLAAVAMFSCGDALGKYIVATYSVGQLMLLRACAALALMSPSIWRQRAAFRQIERPWLQFLRVVLSTLEIAAFFLATVYLPLADVVTYYQATPIFVTALSGLVLGEHIGWRRWSAILVGFVGVLIALRPSAQTITWPAMIALGGSLAFSILMLITRSLRGTPDIVLASSQFVGGLVFGLAIAPAGWVTPTPAQSRPVFRRRRDFDRRIIVRQPFAEARARKHRGAVSIYDDRLGGRVRLYRVRRRATAFDRDRRRRHYRRRALYLPA